METKHLTQSTYETMACPHEYGLVHIEGLKPPDTLPSVRGRDIHEIMAANSEHCAQKRVPMDLAFFDGLVLDTGDDAAAIMRNAGESIIVDWQNFYAAEVSMGLDEDFRPTFSIDHDGHVVPFRKDLFVSIQPSGKRPVVCGILDDIGVFQGNQHARIKDYKSHPRPFEPTTFQAKLYALMLFLHMPELVEIEFVLVFIRYRNIVRPIKFHREQVSELKEEVTRVRNRQAGYHQTYLEEGLEALPALAGTHCTYCPAVSNFKCPIAKLNPMLELAGDRRLHFRLWYAAMNRANNQIMSQMVDGDQAPIHALDANGKRYTFGPVEKERTTYPLFTWNGSGLDMPIVDALQTWMDTAPEDVIPTKRSPKPWPAKLRIGATELNSYLKANKREIVHNNIKDLAETEKAVEYRVQRDAEVDDGTGEEYRDFNPQDPAGENAGAAGIEY